MDCPTLLESLDCFWFFTNVITPPPPPSPSPPLATDTPKPIPPPATTPELDPQLADSPNIGLARPKECSEEGPEQQMHEPQSYDEANRLGECNSYVERRTEVSKGKRRRSREKSQRFHKKEVDEAKELMYLISASFSKHRARAYHCRSVQQPVGKDLAMKKQLRSWAHAVACTVVR